MANGSAFTPEELTLLGLTAAKPAGLFDSEDAARRWAEEARMRIEPEIRRLNLAAARSRARASLYIVD